eukprot:Plantae.Rhodophyta-Hildenbrandia_rubra.ctg6662.p1 GENE.Plantae.Rhodophyta-Hildenbrandia_rubra.ctg6662~~Plantae.Rhodophyta-Hildenbrandia_rubra.ctg6662.p1  ORF type:complete len:649 (+),score=122.89 Plantae.Rhodophyta-Hildenbrandia_rubra.ctg6662:758-2704(+)
MIAIILATLLTIYTIYRLIQLFTPTKSYQYKPRKKPTAKQRLINEAFEFVQDSPRNPDLPSKRLLILYASEYGFSKEVARRTAEYLSGNYVNDNELMEDDIGDVIDSLEFNIRPRVISMAHYKCVDFEKDEVVLVICSTTGDGVPATDAVKFMGDVEKGDVRFGEGFKWGTLALGDKGYPHFCRGGLDADSVLRKSGGKSVLDVKLVDQEDWLVICGWWKEVVGVLRDVETKEMDGDGDYLRESAENYEITDEGAEGGSYSHDSPLKAMLSSKIQLTNHEGCEIGSEEQKNVIRVEFDIQGSGMKYKPGDALGIVPTNDEDVVENILIALGAVGDEVVEVGREEMSIKAALTDKLDLKTVRCDLVVSCAQDCGDLDSLKKAQEIVGADPSRMSAASGRNVVDGWEVLDVLNEFGRGTPRLKQFVKLLRPSHTRYYSVSSTPVKDSERIAITVDVLKYQSRGMERKGVVSTMLYERCMINDYVKIFMAGNENFRLPSDNGLPIIMIGPGTGIAPFIAFLDERQLTSSTGRNVLFFGCRHEKQDYLYKKQLETMEQESLVELYTAFSRDQSEKVYVQDRMRGVGKMLWDLIDTDGAHVYVCGDARKMAPDVHQCLLDIIVEQGGLSIEDAKEYMSRIGKERRYQRDVWAS